MSRKISIQRITAVRVVTPDGYFTAEAIRFFEDVISNRRINAGRKQPLAIAGGIVTIGINFSYLSIDTEGGAASDDLDTIAGGNEGDVLFVEAADSARTIVLKDGAGNIACAGGADISLGHADDLAMLLFDGTKWKASLWDISA
ncbi:hypothetical protein KW797_03150 [Candidatus Parcubacteria bacterium]|nr:hypothetical protein [Candidatus Parcubacteria bacterium]